MTLQSLRLDCHYFLKAFSTANFNGTKSNWTGKDIRCIEATRGGTLKRGIFFVLHLNVLNVWIHWILTTTNKKCEKKCYSFTPLHSHPLPPQIPFIISNTSTFFFVFVSSKSNKSNIFSVNYSNIIIIKMEKNFCNNHINKNISHMHGWCLPNNFSFTIWIGFLYLKRGDGEGKDDVGIFICCWRKLKFCWWKSENLNFCFFSLERRLSNSWSWYHFVLLLHVQDFSIIFLPS